MSVGKRVAYGFLSLICGIGGYFSIDLALRILLKKLAELSVLEIIGGIFFAILGAFAVLLVIASIVASLIGD